MVLKIKSLRHFDMLDDAVRVCDEAEMFLSEFVRDCATWTFNDADISPKDSASTYHTFELNVLRFICEADRLIASGVPIERTFDKTLALLDESLVDVDPFKPTSRVKKSAAEHIFQSHAAEAKHALAVAADYLGVLGLPLQKQAANNLYLKLLSLVERGDMESLCSGDAMISFW